MSDDAQSFMKISMAVERVKSHPETAHVRIVLPVAGPSALPSNAAPKKAVQYVGDYEQVLALTYRREGYDGVVCGHIHHAEIKAMEGVMY